MHDFEHAGVRSLLPARRQLRVVVPVAGASDHGAAQPPTGQAPKLGKAAEPYMRGRAMTWRGVAEVAAMTAILVVVCAVCFHAGLAWPAAFAAFAACLTSITTVALAHEALFG